MARLRIRIELNRGGVGVPLHKLASVVEQAQKFFHMLSEDVLVDQSKGEWLGFDFDHESLNFTAEFVGPVTAEQVNAFHAAFGGSTSLRRTTIAQFARITDAIGEDELIGFGLYLKDDGDEPSEWRCLSRRDALRISEEMQLLVEASGELDGDTRLPAVANSSNAARWFSERHERGVEPAKWVTYVREVEANLDRRIGRVERAIEDQSGVIGDLHLKSTATEDSVRRLLGAVEGFCAQTTRQLEAMAIPPAAVQPPVPSLAPAPAPEPAGMLDATVQFDTPVDVDVTAHVDAPIQLDTPAYVDVTSQLDTPQPAAPPQPAATPGPVLVAMSEAKSDAKPEVTPVVETAPKTTKEPAAEWTPAVVWPAETEPVRTWQPVAETAKEIRPNWGRSARPWANPQRDPRLAVGAALLAIGIIMLSTWAWQNLSASDPSSGVTANDSVPTAPGPAVETATPVQTAQAAPAAQPGAQGNGNIRLDASELTWVSVRNADGNTMLSRLFAPGDEQSLDLPNGATLRVGNAGGLHVHFNGQPVGPLGTHGQVRDVVFRNGSYKIGPPE